MIVRLVMSKLWPWAAGSIRIEIKKWCTLIFFMPFLLFEKTVFDCNNFAVYLYQEIKKTQNQKAYE